MPFITEELWHELKKRRVEEAIIVANWPHPENYQESILKEAEMLFEITSNIRNIRSSKGISPKETLELVTTSQGLDSIRKSLMKLANVSVNTDSEKPAHAFSFVIGPEEFFIPASENIDTEAERKKMTDELNRMIGFKNATAKKLSNEQFVRNAPEQVVAMERKKLADALAKIKTLEESLSNF